MLTQEQIQGINDIFKLWTDHQGAGGQVVVVHKGETVFENCYCYGDIENKVPVTQDSIFSVASVSKQITAMAIMILHDRGQLSVFDDIRKYVPDAVNFPEPVTINHLLHHTGGLREIFEIVSLHDREPGFYLTVPKAVEMISWQKHLNFEPGTRYSYSNAGYMLLAVIVERVSGMSFNEFAQKNIFEPLGMERCVFRDRPDMVIENHVTGYDDNGYEYKAVKANPCTYGSGGLRACCRELVKLMREYVDHKLISQKTMDELHLDIPPLADGTVTNYACGVRKNELLGHKYYHHGGVNAGFRAFTVIFPDDDLVMALATNTYNVPIETAGRDIARIILGLPAREIRGLDDYKTEGVELSGLPGYYYNHNSGRCCNMDVIDGDVCIQSGSAWVKLTPVEGNLYQMGRRNITFALGKKITINNEGVISTMVRLDEKCACPQAYLGQFYSEESRGTYRIEIENGELFAVYPGGAPRMQMHYLKDDCFVCGSMIVPADKLTFARDEQGNVISLTYSAPQMTGMVFDRKA